MARVVIPASPPSFHIEYSVVLADTLGAPAHAEAVVRLSPLCVAFTLLAVDATSVPGDASAEFTFTERVVVLGCVPKDVVVTVRQTLHGGDGVLVYRSTTDAGVAIEKRRGFVAVDGGTRVDESIDCWCPWLLTGIVRRAATSAHQDHMNTYHTLFDRLVAAAAASSSSAPA